MNWKYDDEYSVEWILDGSRYTSKELGPIDREEEEFLTEPAFATENPLQQNPTCREDIMQMERELEVNQQEPTKVEEVKTFEKDAYTEFG